MKTELKRIVLPNGDSFMARVKPRLPKLTETEISEREEMKLRRKPNYMAHMRALTFIDMGYGYRKAARLAGVKPDLTRRIIRNRKFLEKYGVKRDIYRKRIKDGKPLPNMTVLRQLAQASP